MLAEIEAGGEARALQYAKDLDNFTGDVVVTEEAIEKASASLMPGRQVCRNQFARASR